MFFQVWLLSFSIMLSRFTHNVVCMSTVFHFVRRYYSIIQTYHILYIYSYSQSSTKIEITSSFSLGTLLLSICLNSTQKMISFINSSSTFYNPKDKCFP